MTRRPAAADEGGGNRGTTRGRRWTGAALVAVGLMLVSFAGTRYADGAMGAEAARDQWEAERIHMAVAAARRGPFSTVAMAGFEAGSPVARLLIPRLGIDAIVVEGVGNEELNVGPGHLPGSALPGEPGNSVISAHRDRHFMRLGGLIVGDTVVTEFGPTGTRWVVVSRRVVRAGEPALHATEEPTLTLTTCWPIRFFGPAPERLVITARPVAETGSGAAA